MEEYDDVKQSQKARARLSRDSVGGFEAGQSAETGVGGVRCRHDSRRGHQLDEAVGRAGVSENL